MYLKTLLLFIALTGVNAYPKTPCGSAPSHHLILGNREEGDRILFSERYKAESGYYWVNSEEVDYPPPPTHIAETIRHHKYITRIEVYDQFDAGNGGCAFLVQGGIGEETVRLYLVTQMGGKFDFKVNIYGV